MHHYFVIKESILVLIFESEAAMMPVTLKWFRGRKYSQILTLDESGWMVYRYFSMLTTFPNGLNFSK